MYVLRCTWDASNLGAHSIVVVGEKDAPWRRPWDLARVVHALQVILLLSLACLDSRLLRRARV